MKSMNVYPSDLSALRTAVFFAAMRVKYAPGRMADAGRDAEMLVGELQGLSLEVEALPDGEPPGLDYFVNKRLVVRLCPWGLSPNAADAFRGQVRALGAAMGVLVDFSRELMVDGLVTILNGSEL